MGRRELESEGVEDKGKLATCLIQAVGLSLVGA